MFHEGGIKSGEVPIFFADDSDASPLHCFAIGSQTFINFTGEHNLAKLSVNPCSKIYKKLRQPKDTVISNYIKVFIRQKIFIVCLCHQITSPVYKFTDPI